MKVNEVIKEGLGDFVNQLRGGARKSGPNAKAGETNASWLASQKAESDRFYHAPTNLAYKSPTATQSAASQQSMSPRPAAATQQQQGLPPNVKLLARHPIVLQVDKQRFELDDFDEWHPLNRPNSKVSSGQAAILNQYLHLL
jgi:hypothetical protein